MNMPPSAATFSPALNLNTWLEWLATFKVAERRYVEMDLHEQNETVAFIHTLSPPGSVFSTLAFSAAACTPDGLCARYLLCVEREQ